MCAVTASVQTSGPDAIRVVAHRGSSDDAPEHTLHAYKRAIADGADALECDVRLTKDGHLVCVHDRRIDRTSNGRGILSTLELAELTELDWGSWRDTWEDFEDPEMPDRDKSQILTLRRLLETVAAADRRVELAIETKHPTRYAGPRRAPAGRPARRVRLVPGRVAGAGDVRSPSCRCAASARWPRTCAR